MKKRILATILCFVMLMTVFPMMASAQTPQSIEIIDFGTKTYGDKPFKVSVKADVVSKLTSFTYESSNTDVATIGTDGTVTIKALGETVISVKQAGNGTFAPTAASRTLTVNKKDIMLSTLDIDNRKAEFVGILDEDTDRVSVDFNKITLEPVEDGTADEPEDLLVQQGCVKIRGVITENMYTDLDCCKTIDTSEEETVEIVITDAFETANKDFQPDDYGCYEIRDYLVGNTNAADYIGMSVLAYVKELVSNDYEIVSIAADTARNKTLSIDLTQFSQINGVTGKFEYYKTADAKTATAVVIEEDVVVFNNMGGFTLCEIFGDEVACGGATLNSGKITLIDNDTYNGYDIIFVEIAETAVVDEAEDGYVAFKEMTSVTGLVDLVIDEDAEDCVVNITKNGKEISAGDLKEWDVLSIIANEDYSYINAEVITNSVVGLVKSVYKSYSSATGYAYTIGDTKYDVAAGAYGSEDLYVGAGGTFYIDKYGKIAAFKENYALASGQTINYAYVTNAALDTDVLTGANTAIIQLVTADGLVAYNIKATNAKINDVAFDADAVDAAYTVGALVGEVVKYTKNSSNLITAITTADYDDEIITTISSATADQIYDAENGKIGSRYVDADALVFFIAADPADCFLGSVADLEDEVPYTVLALYADEKADDNNILVVEGGREPSYEPDIETDAGYAFITNAALDTDVLTGANTAIVQMVTANGVLAYNIKAENAKINGAVFDADAAGAAATIGGLVGEVIKYTTNSAGLISSIDTIDSDVSITQSAYIFDKNDNRFIGNNSFNVDATSPIFFIDTDNIQESCMGSLLDLKDGEMYDILGKYTDASPDGNNIVVIFADVESPEEEPDPEIYGGYAYVTNAALDTNVLTGANTAIIQLVTSDGLVAYNIKATNAKINGVVFDADAAGAAATIGALVGEVVKYTTNSANLITSITTADIDDRFVSVAQSGTQTYDAENGKFTNFYLDADALVFFIDKDPADCFLGSVADLEDEVSYTVKGLYADDKADDNNILVVEAANTISPKTNMGVLTSIGTFQNEDGEAVYGIQVIINGETIAADTTADVYDSIGNNLTVGDIVKIKIDRNCHISSLEIVYDFADGVRTFDSTTLANNTVTATEGIAGANEVLIGGKVTNYKKTSTLAGVDGETIKLSQAQNVYVIDANGRNLEILNGSPSNFTFYEALYEEGLADVRVTIDGIQFVASQAEAQCAADYVYARMYDGKVVDLVIVKGVANMRVTPGSYVSYSLDNDTGELVPAPNMGIVTNTLVSDTEYGEPVYSINDIVIDDGTNVDDILTKASNVESVIDIKKGSSLLDADKNNDLGIIELLAMPASMLVNATNLILTGEKAENYNLVSNELYLTIKAENMAGLTINAENGTVTGAEAGKYLVGSAITVTAAPNLGYTFKGWYKAGRCVCVEEIYEFVLSADTELTVLFERTQGLSDCGIDESGINWYLYESGIFETEGTDAMYNYSSTAIIPWYYARASIVEVVIGDGITHIGDKSFYNCISLQKIVIPESVESIGTDAFKNCEMLTIYGKSGSYAEAYAKENGISFIEYVKIEKLSDITVDITENTLNWYFDISAEGVKYGANAYVAIYDENDRILNISSDVFATNDLTTIFVAKDANASYAKIFILKTNTAPAAISKRLVF